MADGTGTTEYRYDILNRLASVKNGHGATVEYVYDLANQVEKLTYPNGKSVTKAYDNAGRLHTVTDFASGTSTFNYDANSNVKAIVFPTASKYEDSFSYDEADRMKEAAFKKAGTATASIKYERNEDGQVTKAADNGLAGAAEYAFLYDENSRLKEGASVAYEYDNASNPKGIGIEKLKYDEANQPTEMEFAGSVKVKYGYNAVGQRVKRTPTTGTATAYEYDQAGRLTAVSRPAGTAPAIEDTYSYNGDGLRASRTSESKITYYGWDVAQNIPLLLSDEANVYIYGPGGLPIEQTNSEGGSPRYLHTDQQSSVRMITGAAGEKLGSFTYDGYGYPNASNGTTTSALGYDGQYTDADTGLIYLRARYYDPATAQFTSIDPAVETTAAPYIYASDEPTNRADPTGLYETNANEQRFAHEYSRKLAKINKKLGKLSGHAVEGFEEVALTTFYAVLYNLANDTTLQTRYYVAWESHKNRAENEVYSAIAPLWKLQFATSTGAVLKVLGEVASNAFGIKV